MRRKAVIITSAVVVATLGGGAAAYAATQDRPEAGTDDSVVSGAPSAPSGAEAATDLDAAIEAALAEVGPGTVLDADRDDDVSHAYEIDVRLDGGGEVEVRLDADLRVVSVHDETADDSGSDGTVDDDAVTDETARKKAAEAALAEVGQGTVVSVELSDDADHVYEVEIDLGGGKDADVELDADFAVVKVD